MADREGYSGWWVAGTVIFGVVSLGLIATNVYASRRYMAMQVETPNAAATRLRKVAVVGWRMNGSWLVVAYDMNGAEIARATGPNRSEAFIQVTRSVKQQAENTPREAIIGVPG